MDPNNFTDFVHTGPGTPAGRFMRTFWQPVSVATELAPGNAKPIRVMNEDFTLFRGESGKAYVVDFRCAHRQTQLSA
jgi:5,5'-dehydrodivanillate O-demethylase